MEEKIQSCRIMPEERSYLDKYYDNNFSRFVHDSFKYNIELTKNNKKKNKLQKYSQATILLAFGAIFLFLTTSMATLLGTLLVLLLGVYFTVTGLTTIYYDYKEKI